MSMSLGISANSAITDPIKFSKSAVKLGFAAGLKLIRPFSNKH